MAEMANSYQDLKKIWYDKLKKTGFNDIEDTSNPHAPLKAWHSFYFQSRKMHGLKKEEAEEYYYKAKELLNTYKFADELHRRIWELHCEGWPRRHIEREIKDFNPKYTYKGAQISNIINKIAKEIIS